MALVQVDNCTWSFQKSHSQRGSSAVVKLEEEWIQAYFKHYSILSRALLFYKRGE
jgi:hypothetical protein